MKTPDLKERIQKLFKIDDVIMTDHEQAIKKHWSDDDFFKITLDDDIVLCCVNEKFSALDGVGNVKRSVRVIIL